MEEIIGDVLAAAESTRTTFESILLPARSTRPAGSGGSSARAFWRPEIGQALPAAVTAGRDEYDLKPLFCRPLGDLAEIRYRQQIMQDVERPELFERIVGFADKMRDMRGQLRRPSRLITAGTRNGLLLGAAVIYCAAVHRLSADLAQAEPQSRGFKAFQTWLTGDVGSVAFMALDADTECPYKVALDAVRYNLVLHGLAITVRKYQDEIDYSA